MRWDVRREFKQDFSRKESAWHRLQITGGEIYSNFVSSTKSPSLLCQLNKTTGPFNWVLSNKTKLCEMI